MHSLNSTKFKNGKTLVTFTRKSSMQRTASFDEHKAKQKCIPVGCVPPTVSRSICRERGGGIYARHAPCYTHPSCHTCHLPYMPHAMQAPRHICPPAMDAPLPCISLPCMPPCHTRPLPPPRGQNSRHTLLKILSCPNFVAGGNKRHFFRP